MTKVAVVRLNDVYGTPESRTIIIREVGPLSVVAGLAALVLFGGCVTLMALVLVHYERRRRELAVRIALGASRQRLARALFGELALLAVGGAVGSALVATWSLHIIPSLTLPGSVDLGRLDLSLDWRVLVVAVAVTLLTMLGAALLPVGRFTHASLARELVTGPAATATATSQRTRQVLLALHVCATIVVLVAAGLFVRAVSRGFGNTPGFDTDRTVFVTVQILAPNRKIGQMDAELKVMRERTSRVAEALRSLAGVNVLAEGISPIGANQASALLVPYIIQSGHERRELLLGQMAGSPELLAALGVPILAGRALSSTDATTNPRPAVVTASLARMLWPTEDPLGQIVSLQGRSGRYAIVGIARDFVFGSFSRPAAGVLVTSERAGVGGIEPQFAVRADHPDEVVDSIRKVVSEVLPDAPWLKVETGSSIIARDLGRQRLGAWFFSGFGLTALILSVCGIFGLVSYLTESHRREFGVRLALGATPRCLMRHALRAAMVPVSIGLTAGLLLSALIGRVFASLLAGVSPVDLVTYAAVAFMMLGCAVVAGVSGAWRLQYALPGESLRTD
jgi:predicted permease